MFKTYQEAYKWAFEHFHHRRDFSIEMDCSGGWIIFCHAEPRP
jgi:hypothetical protein